MSFSIEQEPFVPQISEFLPHIPTRAERSKTLTTRLPSDELWAALDLGRKLDTGSFPWVEAARLWDCVTAPENANRFAAIAE